MNFVLTRVLVACFALGSSLAMATPGTGPDDQGIFDDLYNNKVDIISTLTLGAEGNQRLEQSIAQMSANLQPLAGQAVAFPANWDQPILSTVVTFTQSFRQQDATISQDLAGMDASIAKVLSLNNATCVAMGAPLSTTRKALGKVAEARHSDSSALLSTLEEIATLSGGTHMVSVTWLASLNKIVETANEDNAKTTAEIRALDQSLEQQIQSLRDCEGIN